MKNTKQRNGMTVILLTLIAMSMLIDIGDLSAQEDNPRHLRSRFREQGLEIPMTGTASMIFFRMDGDSVFSIGIKNDRSYGTC